MSEPILSVAGLAKRFGGVAANDGIDLAVAAGELHAVIGPNGSGKSTLLSQIFGEAQPDAGSVRFGGREVTGLSVPRRVHLGMARSYQAPSNFAYATARENVAFGLRARAGEAHRWWWRASVGGRRGLAADAILATVGLAARGDTTAGDLAHGEQRQLEIALALSTGPTLLLLDEPFAGLGVGESRDMVALLAKLKGTVTIVLVEHDMEAVFALADRVTVLAEGRVLAAGHPDAVRADQAVRTAYLGEMPR